MLVTKEIGIDMGHTVTYHESKCRHLHGHRYRIVATADGHLITEGSSQGMVIDFTALKTTMLKVIDEPYDHSFVIWDKDPRADLLLQAHLMNYNDVKKFHTVPFVPTAENLAKFWFKELEEQLQHHYHIKLVQLEVFETPTSSAIYNLEMEND